MYKTGKNFNKTKNVRCLLPVRYSLGSSNYTSRPPTGVDLALGLGGYDKVGNNDFPAHKQRPPSTLQPLKAGVLYPGSNIPNSAGFSHKFNEFF